VPTISEVTFSRKYFLGNFETLELSAHAFLAEGEDPKQVFAKLEAETKAYMQTAHPEAFKSSNVSKPSQQVPQQPTKMVQLTIQEQLEKVKQPFGEFEDLLAFTVSDGKVVVRARQFLGSENFAKIASIVRGLGGNYVSAGRDSHFELPLQK